MSIDGVKVIDSDDGYDIYNYIVESYKDGENIDHIIATILGEESNYCTDSFYTEIYWTAFAYSLWKVGHLPEKIKNKALEVIEKGADDLWLNLDAKAQKQRQKVLEKLAVQLQSENLRPIKVPKPKAKRSPHVRVGEVYALKFEDSYGVVLVSQIDESPRKIEYHLACSRLLQKEKPGMDDFLSSDMAFVKYDTKYSLKTDCWIRHKELGLIIDRFEKIGEVELEAYMLGVLSPASTMEDIYEEISSDPELWNLSFKEVYYLIRDYRDIAACK